MKGSLVTVLFVIIAIIIGIAVWHRYEKAESSSVTPAEIASSTTSAAQAFDSSISDGTIIVSYPSKDFGLAVNATQILAKSYIPPCDDKFMYCLYATSTAYAGTNFESAGLRIEKRTDLKTERLCLETPPSGFDSSKKPDMSTSTNVYSSSVFASVGDAGAGHYAQGSLYRLFYRASDSCYELETRIGETQFANYPAGSIKEFTEADRTTVMSSLSKVLQGITLQTGESRLFTF